LQAASLPVSAGEAGAHGASSSSLRLCKASYSASPSITKSRHGGATTTLTTPSRPTNRATGPGIICMLMALTMMSPGDTQIILRHTPTTQSNLRASSTGKRAMRLRKRRHSYIPVVSAIHTGTTTRIEASRTERSYRTNHLWDDGEEEGALFSAEERLRYLVRGSRRPYVRYPVQPFPCPAVSVAVCLRLALLFVMVYSVRCPGVMAFTLWHKGRRRITGV